MKTWPTLLLLLVCAGIANAATIRGTVTDVTGAAVQNAYVFVFDDQARISSGTTFPGKRAITARSGAFELEVVPGFYDVCVFSSGFSTACEKMHIMNGTNSVAHDVKLQIDPLILKERGDTFSPH